MTNRELYLAIAELRDSAVDRPLEDYLRALYLLSSEHSRRASIESGQFLDLITRAFASPPAPFDREWFKAFREDSSELSGFDCFESTILSQIVDLHEMAAAGALGNDLKYFGIQSPRGRSWYNFDPLTYLECAVAGSIGGWEPGDSTARDFVPSDAMMMDETGNMVFVDRRDVVFEITSLSWEQFAEFLEMGRLYE